jgi:ATP-dependent protease ClpP protease subunit
MAKLVKEHIDRWLLSNVDTLNRTIYMGSIRGEIGDEPGVDAFMAESVIKSMHLLETLNSDPITILMNNPGGDVFHGLAIYDVIQTAKSHCIIKVYGQAMSMGSLILQAADKRIMMPHSKFMIHYGYDSQENNSKTVIKWIDENKRLAYFMENVYLETMMEKEKKEGHGHIAKILSQIMTKQYELEYPPSSRKVFNYSFSKREETKKEEIRSILKEMLNFDTILTAEETVDLGFADEIYKP